MPSAPATTQTATPVTPVTGLRRVLPRRRRPEKRSLVARIARTLLSLTSLMAMLLAAFGSVGLAALSATGSYRTAEILTGSMANIYPPGTVVLLGQRPLKDLREGTVIAFAPPGVSVPVLHRVVRILDETKELTAPSADGEMVQDTSKGSGERDYVAARGSLLDLPHSTRATSKNPLIITKGDTNPIIDTWSPVRLSEDRIWVPLRTVPQGRVILRTFSDPTIFRTVGALAMVLIGWPLLARIWMGPPGQRGAQAREDDDIDGDDDDLLYPPAEWFDDPDLNGPRPGGSLGSIAVPVWDFDPDPQPLRVRERVLVRVRATLTTGRDVLGPVSLGFTVRRAARALREVAATIGVRSYRVGSDNVI